MPVSNIGTLFPWEVQEIVGQDLTEILTKWNFVNTTPLFSRLPKVRTDQVEYTSEGNKKRPATVQVTGARLATDTTLTLADVTYLMNGDVLHMTFADGSVEQIEVIGDPDEAASTVPVKRGDASTVAGAIPDLTLLTIIGNSRTGGEKWQKGIAPRPWNGNNWCQTIQHPVEIAGLTQDTRSLRTRTIAPGATDPLDAYRMNALGNVIQDTEGILLYSRGISPTASNTKRAKTKGFRQLCQDAGSYRWQPTNYAAYTPYDFARDVAETPSGVGGAPNFFMVSANWQGGLAKWKMPMVKMDMGETDMDVTIRAFRTDVSDGIFIINPKMKPGSLFAFNDADIFVRFMRMPTYKERGNSGDTYEGDVIARIGAQLNNPEQQRYLEGITGWAAAA